MSEICEICGRPSVATYGLGVPGTTIDKVCFRVKAGADTTCYRVGYERSQEALAAANARADRAEVELRVSGAAYGSLQDSLAAARRECEQAESERDAASEVLRDALAWEAETRGRLGLPQIDAPPWAQIARAALAAPAPAPGEET